MSVIVKVVNWRDISLGFVRPLDRDKKAFVGRMDSYPVVVGQLQNAVLMERIVSSTDLVTVAAAATVSRKN